MAPCLHKLAVPYRESLVQRQEKFQESCRKIALASAFRCTICGESLHSWSHHRCGSHEYPSFRGSDFSAVFCAAPGSKNCAVSVEPSSAVVDDVPLVMTF